MLGTGPRFLAAEQLRAEGNDTVVEGNNDDDVAAGFVSGKERTFYVNDRFGRTRQRVQLFREHDGGQIIAFRNETCFRSEGFRELKPRPLPAAAASQPARRDGSARGCDRYARAKARLRVG